MVAQYTVMGRQVGSHYVGASSVLSRDTPLIQDPALLTVYTIK